VVVIVVMVVVVVFVVVASCDSGSSASSGGVSGWYSCRTTSTTANPTAISLVLQQNQLSVTCLLCKSHRATLWSDSLTCKSKTALIEHRIRVVSLPPNSLDGRLITSGLRAAVTMFVVAAVDIYVLLLPAGPKANTQHKHSWKSCAR